MEVRCNVDLYGGEVKAGKWYPAQMENYTAFTFENETGCLLFCRVEDSAHLKDHPGAFWEFRNVGE